MANTSDDIIVSVTVFGTSSLCHRSPKDTLIHSERAHKIARCRRNCRDSTLMVTSLSVRKATQSVCVCVRVCLSVCLSLQLVRQVRHLAQCGPHLRLHRRRAFQAPDRLCAALRQRGIDRSLEL